MWRLLPGSESTEADIEGTRGQPGTGEVLVGRCIARVVWVRRTEDKGGYLGDGFDEDGGSFRSRRKGVLCKGPPLIPTTVDIAFYEECMERQKALNTATSPRNLTMPPLHPVQKQKKEGAKLRTSGEGALGDALRLRELGLPVLRRRPAYLGSDARPSPAPAFPERELEGRATWEGAGRPREGEERPDVGGERAVDGVVPVGPRLEHERVDGGLRPAQLLHAHDGEAQEVRAPLHPPLVVHLPRPIHIQ